MSNVDQKSIDMVKIKLAYAAVLIERAKDMAGTELAGTLDRAKDLTTTAHTDLVNLRLDAPSSKVFD